MKRERVEGYAVDEQDMFSAGGVDDAWLAGLREEARLALIRRIVLDRLANGGFSGAPKPVDLDSSSDGFEGMDDAAQGGSASRSFAPIIRDLVIGVGISVLSAWVCTLWKIGQAKGRR